MTAKYSLWPCLIVMGCLASVIARAEVNDSSAKVPWSYVGAKGPTHWGMLSAAFETCDLGKTQSPINISREKTRVPFSLSIDYKPVPLILGEDIDMEMMIGKAQTVVSDGHGIQLNFNKQKIIERMTFEGDDYKLLQLHFHTPSETLWHKQSYPAEIHFVHQGKDGKVAVVAVFVKGGAENAALKVILDNVPKESAQEVAVPNERIFPAELLPVDKRYYTFAGSLTTPPCSEGLKWIVLSTPITASPAQILKIRQVAGGANARPAQPLNNREIHYAVE